jgi:hypothetical protein
MTDKPLSYGDRFLARYGGSGLSPDVAVTRTEARKVLRGVPWQFIPVFRHREFEYPHSTVRRLITLRTLAMLCACLDEVMVDRGVTTIEGLTADDVRVAWMAAGHENWLRRVTFQRAAQVAARRAAAPYMAELIAAKLQTEFSREKHQ